MGGENYKEFDTSSIVTSNGKDTLSIGKVTLRKREAALGLIALIALLGVLILVIVLAVEVNDKPSCPDSLPSVSSGALVGKGSGNSTTPPVPPPTTHSSPNSATAKPITPTEPCQEIGSFCTTPSCLRASWYEQSLMDVTVNPCQDFYSYACGSYPKFYPMTAIDDNISPARQILVENTEKLIYLLESTPDRPSEESYERKIREFMSSCSNHFDKMDQRGRPLIEKIIDPLGGWYVFGEFDASKFSLHDTLAKVHIDYWTAAFFSMTVKTDQTDWNKKVVELDFGGVGLPVTAYGHENLELEVQNIYKAYMRTLATLLSADANVTIDQSLISQFTDDAYEVELQLADVILHSPTLQNPHQQDKRMKLSELNTLTDNEIDFVDYMKTAFNEYPSLFSGDTYVAVARDQFFHKLGPLLANYTSTPTGKRMLHNYLLWKVINAYAVDLSWDYVHASRKLDNILYGAKDDSSGYTYCFTSAENGMRDAMNAIFVNEFVNKQDKDEATKVMEYIKQEMLDSFTNIKWMSEEDKVEARTKIEDSLYKIGYDEKLVDDDYMDQMYSFLDISKDDYFGNIININKMHRHQYNLVYGKPASRTVWTYHTFEVAVEYYNPWHELIATAGLFQTPLFSSKGPSYYNYGGIGTILARSMVHAVDEYGNAYSLDGSQRGSWWNKATTDKYKEIKKCAIDSQADKIIGPFVDPDHYLYNLKLNMSDYSLFHAPELLADASGLRLSYRAYKKKLTTEGLEQIPAGLHDKTNEQMFFVAYAQAYCENNADVVKFENFLNNMRFPNKNRVNLAVSHVPEFKQAFSCPTGSPMVNEKSCVLFK